MAKTKSTAFDLKEACVHAAREVIAELGVESWSMRDVARRLEISHQAPYRHFASRDHLLAEIMRRCFVDFAEHLDRRVSGDSPQEDLHGMGMQYLDYAALKPLEYRLMFGTTWPEPAQHPQLVVYAVHAFDILRQSLRRMHGDTAKNYARADLDAMFIWATLHGMASITQANVMQHLVLEPGVVRGFRDDVMTKIGVALAGSAQPLPSVSKSIKSKKSSQPKL
jgi:AcrR family transcriptional regulator